MLAVQTVPLVPNEKIKKKILNNETYFSSQTGVQLNVLDEVILNTTPAL